MIGLRMKELHEGALYPVDRPTDERSVRLQIECRAHSVRALLESQTLDVSGEVYIAGLAVARPVEGTLALRVADERRIYLLVRFHGDDGKRYELSMHKDFVIVAPLRSVREGQACLRSEDGAEVARGPLRLLGPQPIWSVLRTVRLGAAS